MSQSRRTIEQLLKQGRLPLSNVEAAASHLQVYPNAHTWRTFFDKAALIVGVIALVLSLVFFVAYNWQDLGKMGKFALVEGALAITIALYVALSFRKRYTLIRQLLLLIASVITGSLLALFGQVYQTGADTWQLFFAWAVLILPWVVIARFPALWLLWLGLINSALLLHIDVADFVFSDALYQYIFQVEKLAFLNFVALNLWLLYIDDKRLDAPSLSRTATYLPQSNNTTSNLHWSTYIVGLISTCSFTYLGLITVFEDGDFLAVITTLLLWVGWCAFMYWRFYLRDTDLLMLTYLCFSSIIVVMFWVNRLLLSNIWETGGFLILALLLVTMSSAAVVWLRKVANTNSSNHKIAITNGGAEHE